MKFTIKLMTFFSLLACLGLPALAEQLVPVGAAVGIEIETDGLLVVSMSEVRTQNGTKRPAADCGLEPGDLIVGIGGRKIRDAADFKEAMGEIGENEVPIRVLRDGNTLQFDIKPALSDEGSLEIGVWLRDGISGIGTVTFYDPESGVFGALGHAVNDSETGVMLPVRAGSIKQSSEISVVKGKAGTPGELQASFDETGNAGDILENTAYGIFGIGKEGTFQNIGSAAEIALPEEVRPGKALIISNIEDGTPQEYEAEITKLCPTGGHDFMIKVTDERLLSGTGGIVQGMSGSPVLQNGKFVGAVTHVLVNDPERGYGVFIDTMLSACSQRESDRAA